MEGIGDKIVELQKLKKRRKQLVKERMMLKREYQIKLNSINNELKRIEEEIRSLYKKGE